MRLTRVLRALADPTRRRVYEALVLGPKSTSSVARGMPVSRPAVSQHLRELKSAGLVAIQRSGSRHLYAIDRRGPVPLYDWLRSLSESIDGQDGYPWRDDAPREL